MTRAWPPRAAIMSLATPSAKMKPLHTALRSNAAALVAPSRCCTIVAVGGCGWSGVEVASTISWRSPGASPARLRAWRPACSARSDEASDSAARRRDRIPVLCSIQWASTPAGAPASVLSTIRLGRWPPQPKAPTVVGRTSELSGVKAVVTGSSAVTSRPSFGPLGGRASSIRVDRLNERCSRDGGPDGRTVSPR